MDTPEVTLLPIVAAAIMAAHRHKEKAAMPQAEMNARNVLGSPLQPCSEDPLTGFYRDGCCNTGSGDVGVHTVCVRVTEEFLRFSRARGNDLSTPMPDYEFPGLHPGDQWCLCAMRWKEAYDAGMAPKVVLESTHIMTLEFVKLSELKEHAL